MEKLTNDEAISFVFNGDEPVELFSIQGVNTNHPDIPIRSNLFRKTETHLVGNLIFIDKGICFAGLAEYELPTPKTGFGGLIGGGLATIDEVSNRKFALSQASKILESQEILSLKGVMEKALKLIIFNKEKISGIELSPPKGFIYLTINSNNISTRFYFEGDKHTYEINERRIHEYLLNRTKI